MADLTPERLAGLKALEKVATEWHSTNTFKAIPVYSSRQDFEYDVALRNAAPALIAAAEERDELRAKTAVKPKIAPVQGYKPGIPWDMHLRAYAAYCKKWGKQDALIDLEGRNCRGGFSTRELDGFIPGWLDELSERSALCSEVANLRALLVRAGEATAKALDQFRVIKTFLSYANQDVVSAAVAQGNENMAWHEAVKGAENAEHALAEIRRATQPQEPKP